MGALKSDFIKGTIWSIIGQFVTLFIVLLGNIWLARLLSPNDFGIISIVMFFITIASVFVEGGLGGALIRKKEIENIDYSTVFIFNLLVSIILFFILWIFAKPIAAYYNNKILIEIIPVGGFVLIFNAFQLIQNTRLIREMKFKERAIARISAILLSSIIGVLLAYQGFGVWSLVVLQVLNSLFNSIFITLLDPKKLKLNFSLSSFKELYAFGMNTTLASLINVSFDNVYQLILARYFSITQTGYYYQAKKIQDVPGGVVNLLSQSVLFSTLSKLQDDKETYLKVYLKIVRFFIVFLGLFSLIFFIYSNFIVSLLLGDKWIDASFYLRLLTIASFFYFMELINRVSFKVFNKTNLILILEVIKKAIQIVGIIVGIYKKDIELLLVLFIVSNIISYLLNNIILKTKLNLDSKKELIIVLIVSLSVITCISVHNLLLDNFAAFKAYPLVTLPILLCIYLLILKITKTFDVIASSREIINKILNKRKKGK